MGLIVRSLEVNVMTSTILTTAPQIIWLQAGSNVN